MKKVLNIFTDYGHRPERVKKNTFGALGYYRMFKPHQRIEKYQADIRGTDINIYGDTPEKIWEKVFKEYDLVWSMHFLGEATQAMQIYFRNKYKKKLVYDIDDNYLDVPESNPVHEKFKKTKRDRAILSTSFFFADALTVSTEPLRERLLDHFKTIHGVDKEIFIVPNMNDTKDWNFAPAEKHTDRIVIGYSGSNSHQDDLLVVLPAINKLMTKYKTLWFEIIGAIDKSKLDHYFSGFDKANLDRVAMRPATATFWEYPEYLSQQKWDIGIAPLVDTNFTRCKSHIKWLEYSMYKIPTVASRVYPYFMELEGRQTIIDDVTGLLCRPVDWEMKLERLILNKELRMKIGQNAYQYVKERWQYDSFSVDTVIDKILNL